MNTIKVEVVVPGWVEWIAIDKDGTCCGFEEEPYVQGSFEQWAESGYGNFTELYSGKPPKNWKLELYEYK